MQEGQVWETLMAAGKFIPGNLIFVLDRNGGQIDGPVNEVMSLDPLTDKIKSFNWDCEVVDGHSLTQLKTAFAARQTPKTRARPLFVIANTTKGKGVSFMENNGRWHGVAPTKDEVVKANLEIWGSSGSPQGTLLEGAEK
jgi:transketolase